MVWLDLALIKRVLIIYFVYGLYEFLLPTCTFELIKGPLSAAILQLKN